MKVIETNYTYDSLKLFSGISLLHIFLSTTPCVSEQERSSLIDLYNSNTHDSLAKFRDKLGNIIKKSYGEEYTKDKYFNPSLTRDFIDISGLKDFYLRHIISKIVRKISLYNDKGESIFTVAINTYNMFLEVVLDYIEKMLNHRFDNMIPNVELLNGIDLGFITDSVNEWCGPDHLTEYIQHFYRYILGSQTDFSKNNEGITEYIINLKDLLMVYTSLKMFKESKLSDEKKAKLTPKDQTS